VLRIKRVRQRATEREVVLGINGIGLGQKWPLVKSTLEYFYQCKSILQTTVNQD